MKFWGINGRLYPVELRQTKWPRRTAESSKSHLQWSVSQRIDEVFPTQVVLEEFTVPHEGLFLDFFLPMKRIAVEVHGEQHIKFNKFFHGNIAGFNEHKARDARKKEWCALNNIKLIEIMWNDDEKTVLNKLKMTDG